MIDLLIAAGIVLVLGIPFVAIMDRAKKEMEAEDREAENEHNR